MNWIIQAIIVTLFASFVTIIINYLVDKNQFKNILERIKSLVKL